MLNNCLCELSAFKFKHRDLLQAADIQVCIIQLCRDCLEAYSDIRENTDFDRSLDCSKEDGGIVFRPKDPDLRSALEMLTDLSSAYFMLRLLTNQLYDYISEESQESNIALAQDDFVEEYMNELALAKQTLNKAESFL